MEETFERVGVVGTMTPGTLHIDNRARPAFLFGIASREPAQALISQLLDIVRPAGRRGETTVDQVEVPIPLWIGLGKFFLPFVGQGQVLVHTSVIGRQLEGTAKILASRFKVLPHAV